MRFRKLMTFVATAALVTMGAIATPLAASAAPAAQAVKMGPSAGGTCPPLAGVAGVYANAAGYNPPQPVDQNTTVYVGGNFTRVAGAETEGRMVVNGNAAFNAQSGGGGLSYNLGQAGVGSGLMAQPNTDVLKVGGNVTVDAGLNLIAGLSSATSPTLPANVTIGGTLSGGGTINATGVVTSGVGAATALGSTFSTWPNNNFQLLSTIAQNNWNNPAGVAGIYNLSGGTLTLTGAPGASRHLFTIPASALTGSALTLNIGANIGATDPVIVQVTGGPAALNIGSVQVNGAPLPGDTGSQRYGQMAQQLLWLFPTATSVTIGGPGAGQVPGSVIVPTPGSTTTLAAPGANGRYWVAGDLIQNKPGSEFHNFPFIGDSTMTCGQPPVPAASATPVAPTVTQAACTGGGQSSSPTVTLASTPGIAYAQSGQVVAGGTVIVTATPQSGYALVSPLPGNWTAGPNGTATYTVTLTQPSCTQAVTPVAPTVVQAVCTGPGQSSAPTVTLASTPGIAYTQSGQVVAGGTVIVTATPQSGYALVSPLPGNWTAGPNGTATFTVTLTQPSCTQTAIPAPPMVLPAVCTGPGQSSTPMLMLMPTMGITYTQSGQVVAGGTVIVTATPQSGYVLASPLPGNWTAGPNGTATYTVTLTQPDCTQSAPLMSPKVVQAVCTGPGQVSSPSVTPAPGSAAVSYQVSGAMVPGSLVVVLATPGAGYAFSSPLPDGWVLIPDGTATFTVVLTQPDCTQSATPVAPAVTPSVCTGPGQSSTPVIGLVDTPHVAYTFDQSLVKPGASVPVTATAASGYAFSSPLPNGWVLNTDGTATFTVVLTQPDCTVTATPATPAVNDAVCTQLTAGQTIWQTVTTPTPTAQLVYSQATDANHVTTVTATAQVGYRIGATDGWTVTADGSAATYTVQLTSKYCDQTAVPVAPAVNDAVCTQTTAGQTVWQTVTLASTTGVTYAQSTDANHVVTVTATPGAGYVLGAAAGWTVNADGTATFTQQLTSKHCDQTAVPVAPAVDDAVCTQATAGQTVWQTVTLASTTGVTYAQSTDANHVVTVTATPASGYVLGAASGWTVNADGTATFTQQLTSKHCDLTPAELVSPVVVQAVCTGPGQVSSPSVTPAVGSAAVSYQVSGAIQAGSTVLVTATPGSGYAFSSPVPNGWTLNADGTATFTVVLAQPDCVVGVQPVQPVVTQSVCTGPGQSSTPVIGLVDTPHVAYTFDQSLVKPGASVPVKATAASGYAFSSPLPNGWVLNTDGTATFTVVLTQPDCTVTAMPVAPAIKDVMCTGPDQSSTPSLTPESTPGIVYTQSGQVEAGGTATVTATPQSGYALSSSLQTGWVAGPNGTATFTVTFANPDCVITATPVAPTINDAVCTPATAGQTVWQSVTTPTPTAELVYSQSTDANHVTMVTATAQAGYRIGAVDGWTVTEDGSAATYTVQLTSTDCARTPVAPAAPAVTQAVCTDVPGQASVPTVVPAITEGVTYSMSGDVVAGGTVVITATPDASHQLSEAEGWQLQENGTATYRIDLASPDCRDSVAPVSPQVTQALCLQDATLTNPSVVVPANTAGVHYTIGGTVAPGNTVTVTAAVQSGYKFSTPPAGWTTSEDGSTATFTVALTKPTCAVPAGILPVTGGGNPTLAALFSGIMLLGGASVLLFARRRRVS